MDFSDLGNRFVLSVDDLCGVWTPIYEHLKTKLPLRQVTFKNKFGVQTSVDELPIQFLSSSDPRLQKLRQYSHSPVTWFRNPFVQLVLVSCEEGEEYKRAYRQQLKAMVETEGRLGVTPELLFVYLRPSSVDALAKGPAKAEDHKTSVLQVFDSMRRDLNLKRHDRCVRLDPAPAELPHAGMLGLEELERALKEAIRASFEARTAAYDEEVRRLMLSRQQDPSWSFPTLFLFKDSLAVMMEAGGLLDDALREYYELEAVYLEAIQAGQLARQSFGGKPPDADEAALMWQSWHSIRQAVLQGDSVPEFAFRQFLFASQARVLLKQHRLVEVAERGLGFIQLFGGIIEQKERDGQVPPHFGAAWAFAAALALASTLSSMQAQRAEHRRQTEQGRSMSVSRWKSRTLGPSSRPASPSLTPPSPTLASPASSQPVSVGNSASQGLSALETVPMSPLAVTPVGRVSGAGEAAGGDFEAQVNWALGSLPGDSAAWELEMRSHRKGDTASVLYCLLGHLYSNARSELMQLGEGLGLGPPQPGGAAVLDAALGGSSLPTPLRRPFSANRLLSGTRKQAAFSTLQSPHTLTTPSVENRFKPPTPPLPSTGALSHTASAASQDGFVPGGGYSGEALPGGSSMQAVDLESRPPTAAAAVPPPLAVEQALRQQRSQSDGAANQAGSVLVPPLNLAAAPGVSDSSGDTNARESDPGSFAVHHARAGSVASNASLDTTVGIGFGGLESGRSISGREDPSVVRRLSVRTTRAPMDTESQASTPKSTISQVSGSPTRASQLESQHAAAAAAAAALASGGLVGSAAGDVRSQLADARAIERQVMSPAASLQNIDLLPPASTRLEGDVPPFSLSPSHDIPPWLVHWRLRLGLASEELFCDLWRALSEAAAQCYGQCGRRRHAALLHADVADVLMWRGDMQGAAQLYHHQCCIAIKEGWYSLAAQTLPKLAACQVAVGSWGLAHTAAAMLAIPSQYRLEGGEERTACRLLLTAAAADANGSSMAAYPPLLGSLDADGALAMPHLLSCNPPPSLSSRFFGLTDWTGAPVLSPPAGDVQQAQHGGALLATVGDVVVLTVHIVSEVPAELPLSRVVLTLGVMQQLTVIYTPRTSALHVGGPPSPGAATPSSLARVSTASTPTRPLGGAPASVAAHHKGGAMAAAAAAAAAPLVAGPPEGGDGSSKFVSKWQEVEELQCRLIGISSLKGGGGTGGSGTWGSMLRPGTNVLTFLASPVKRGVYIAKHIRAFLQFLPIHIDVLPPPSLLSPHFRDQHAKQAQHSSSSMGWAVAAPAQLHLSPPRRSRRGSTSVDGGTASAFKLAKDSSPLGSSLLGGDSASGWGDSGEEIVVMLVESARPRVALSLVAPGASVIAGQKQWLGLVVHPERDRLRGTSLALTWPSAGAMGTSGTAGPGVAAGGLLVRRTHTLSCIGTGYQHTTAQFSSVGVTVAGAHSSPFKAASMGSLGMHRATMSLGGASDLLTTRIGGTAASSAATLALAPLGPGAVALPLDPGSSAGTAWQDRICREAVNGGEGEVLVAEESPSGASNWLLGDLQEQQQFTLPAWAAQVPACTVWWWVETAAYTNAPEVVRIAAPGSQPPPVPRPHDSHFLPGESPLNPAAASCPALDLAVNLEYDCGCHRSHSRALTVPITEPFIVHFAAQELPSGTIAVQVVLQSNLAVPLHLTTCTLTPQPGLELKESMAQRMGLLPLRLSAGASASLAFMLQLSDSVTGASMTASNGKFDRAAAALRLQQAAKLQPSVLSVEYELDNRQLCKVPAAALNIPGAGREEVAGGPPHESSPIVRPLQQQQQQPCGRDGGKGSLGWVSGYKESHHLPPASPAEEVLQKLEELAPAASAMEGLGDEEGGSPIRNSSSAGRVLQQCNFTQLLVLQLAPPEDEAQGAMVLLRLLGPFTAVAGQPVTLCWILERSTAGSAGGVPAEESAVPRQTEAVPLHYEVLAEGDSWRPLGRRSGKVSLGSQAGAVATIEASWVPLMHGTLPVPALKIQEIRYQELFDVGNENNFIRVLPMVEGRTAAPTL